MPDLVLVATDGGRVTTSALRVASAYAEAEGAALEVLAVVEPLSELPMPLPHQDELEHAHGRGVADRVREQVRDLVGPAAWPLHVGMGRPAPSIFEAARSRSADLIILGLDAHEPVGNSTTVELLHLVDIPVLVAREAELPRTAVVGVDFRASSVCAAREALRFIGSSGTLHLVHVRPPFDFPAASVWAWSERYDGTVAAGFDRLIAELGPAAESVTTATHTCAGDAAGQLLHLAAELGADLLAIGVGGYVCNGRVVVGRVARRLAADPPIALLASPVCSRAPRLDTRTRAAHAVGPA